MSTDQIKLMKELESLAGQGLVIRKYSDKYPDYVLYKYHNKVFYNNLWHVNPALLEARGIVFNVKTGEVVQRPFHKIFNVGENGTVKPPSELCCDVVYKVNGFMAAASQVDGEIFVTTTGSMDSSYATLAESYLDQLNWCNGDNSLTFLFEVCDLSDPHIVEEKQGVYLLSVRYKSGGYYFCQHSVKESAKRLGCNWAGDLEPTDKSEGVVYYSPMGTPLAKTKTKHYLSKKALMRMGAKQVGIMYDHPETFRQRLDEEFYDLYSFLLDNYTREMYHNLNEQDRRSIIENWFEENGYD